MTVSRVNLLGLGDAIVTAVDLDLMNVLQQQI